MITNFNNEEDNVLYLINILAPCDTAVIKEFLEDNNFIDLLISFMNHKLVTEVLSYAIKYDPELIQVI